MCPSDVSLIHLAVGKTEQWRGCRVPPPLSQCGPRIERLRRVFPPASGSGYALSIGFLSRQMRFFVAPASAPRAALWSWRRLNCTCETTRVDSDRGGLQISSGCDRDISEMICPDGSFDFFPFKILAHAHFAHSNIRFSHFSAECRVDNYHNLRI